MSRIIQEVRHNQKFFYAYTKFKTSKYVSKEEFNIVEYVKTSYIKELNYFSKVDNWEIIHLSDSSCELRFYLLNDLNLTLEEFYKLLYKSLIQEKWINDSYLNQNAKSFIRGFFETRGSIDTSWKLIAQDYFYNNKNELKRALILIEMMNIPFIYCNFNPRDLQPQFVSGESKRNTQLRLNVYYYANKIGFLNKYKALIFKNTYAKNIRNNTIDFITYFDIEPPFSNKDDLTFIKYLNFFTNNIYEKKLNQNAVNLLRKKLGVNKKDLNDNKKIYRNQNIIELFKEYAKDICAVCETKTTFTSKNSNKQYFEIHHVISYFNDKELDNIANLVKLCPTCHAMLKKGVCIKQEQIAAIKKILNENHEIYEFTSSYLGIDDIDKLVEEIWNHLG